MYRTREFRRDVRNRKIAHKKYICNHVNSIGSNWYKHDGQYSKGKIHCSCPLCTYSKFYDYPRLKDIIDRDRVKDALKDLE